MGRIVYIWSFTCKLLSTRWTAAAAPARGGAGAGAGSARAGNREARGDRHRAGAARDTAAAPVHRRLAVTQLRKALRIRYKELMSQQLALVLSGGGARGAYEAGVIHYIRTALPAAQRQARIDLFCATSVGAINAVYLASTAERPQEQGRLLRSLWEGVQQDRIFQRDWLAVGRFLLQTGFGLLSNFVRLDPGSRRLQRRSRFVSLFDTSPLPRYLESLIDLPQVSRNLAAGHFAALALSATNLDTDGTELFVQRRSEVTYSGDFPVHDVRIGIDHILASAAIPFAFPPIKVGQTYYCDGGVRLNTPMSPAIQLGADRILTVATHAQYESRFPPPQGFDEYPSPGRLIAAVTESIFSDKVRSDLDQLRRINRIIQWAQEVCEPDFLQRLNRHISETGARGDIADRGVRKIEALMIRPSQDIGQIFKEQLEKNPYLDPSFSTFERFVMRLFAIDPREGRELLSYLVFSPKYVRALMELGYEDARRCHDPLIAFFTGERLPVSFPQLVAES